MFAKLVNWLNLARPTKFWLTVWALSGAAALLTRTLHFNPSLDWHLFLKDVIATIILWLYTLLLLCIMVRPIAKIICLVRGLPARFTKWLKLTREEQQLQFVQFFLFSSYMALTGISIAMIWPTATEFAIWLNGATPYFVDKLVAGMLIVFIPSILVSGIYIRAVIKLTHKLQPRLYTGLFISTLRSETQSELATSAILPDLIELARAIPVEQLSDPAKQARAVIKYIKTTNTNSVDRELFDDLLKLGLAD